MSACIFHQSAVLFHRKACAGLSPSPLLTGGHGVSVGVFASAEAWSDQQNSCPGRASLCLHPRADRVDFEGKNCQKWCRNDAEMMQRCRFAGFCWCEPVHDFVRCIQFDNWDVSSEVGGLYGLAMLDLATLKVPFTNRVSPWLAAKRNAAKVSKLLPPTKAVADLLEFQGHIIAARSPNYGGYE